MRIGIIHYLRNFVLFFMIHLTIIFHNSSYWYILIYRLIVNVVRTDISILSSVILIHITRIK